MNSNIQSVAQLHINLSVDVCIGWWTTHRFYDIHKIELTNEDFCGMKNGSVSPHDSLPLTVSHWT